MSCIHRMSVEVKDYQELDLGGGMVLSVAADRDGRSAVFDMWFESDGGSADPTAIYVLGTGHVTPWNAEIRYAWVFIGTVVTPSGLVWHVYRGPRKDEAIPA